MNAEAVVAVVGMVMFFAWVSMLLRAMLIIDARDRVGGKS